MSTSIETNITNNDPTIGFNVAGTRKFTIGVDDSDSDKFKISTTSIGTNDRIAVDSSGDATVSGNTTFNGTNTIFGTSIVVNRVITSDSSYTVSTSGADYVIMTDTTSNAITVTLPTVDSGDVLTVGRVIHVIDIGGNASTNNITITSASNISGATSQIIAENYNSISVISSTSAWFVY